MNAPEPHRALYEQLPLLSLMFSSSPVQVLRRQGITDASIKELADSFANGIGIVEPLIVRPLVRPRETSADGMLYEIVAGERRSRAAGVAGLDTVPCLIRHLDDAQALKIQMIENLQRNAYGALEEATGFRELLRLKSTPGHAYTPQDLGSELGKSRSYVYARLKLLDLCPEGQAALQAGEIDASKALLLARFRSKKLQAKALEILLQRDYYSYRKLVDELRDKFMQDLGKAPFDLDDANLFLGANLKALIKSEALSIACTTCPHNSGNDPELQADFDDDARVCTHAPCYELKVVAFHARRVDQARRDGRTVLSGDEAKALIPRTRWGHGLADCDAKHLNLDAVCDFPEEEPDYDDSDDATTAASDKAMAAYEARRDKWGNRTYRDVLGEAVLTGVTLDLGKDGVHEIVPVREAANLLKAKGIELDVPEEERERAPAAASRNPEADKRAQEKEDLRRHIELEYRARLYKAIVGKWKGPLKRAELEQLYAIIMDYTSVSDELLAEAFGGKIPDPKKASEADVVRLIFAVMFSGHEIESTYNKPGHLLDYAGRLKIDAKKIRAEVTKDLAPKPEPAAAKGKKK